MTNRLAEHIEDQMSEERFELLSTLPDGDVMVIWSASGSGQRHACLKHLATFNLSDENEEA